jgi:Holliday junction resolvase RusA-like endonuclease
VTTVRVTIPGVPQQQGSKKHIGNGRMIEANKKLKPWRDRALECIRAAKNGQEGPLFFGPISVTMIAYFPRPASHYGTGRNAGVLKPGAPFWHSTAPDCDKVQRAVGDALTEAGMILDDRLIVTWDPACKVYGDPRVDLIIADADPIPEFGPDLLAVPDEQDALL